MSNPQLATSTSLSPLEQLTYAREILRLEGQALVQLADELDREFCRAVELLFECSGSVLVIGMGKAGLIGQKISATFASTGTRSHYLHPGEAYHGDLGRIHRSDVVLVLSQSGETDEVVRLLPALATFGVSVIAITGRPESTLGRAATVIIDLGRISEVCGLGLAPTTSTTLMLGLGDALALVTSRQRGFSAEDFARFHPGGSLGRKLSKVSDHMRPLAECRIAAEDVSVREALSCGSRPGRRTGAVMLTDATGKLTGIFTDSDLVKLLEQHREHALDGPICDVMTRQPSTVVGSARMAEAVTLLARRKISELPVIDSTGRPLGLIDITDIAGLLPEFEPGEKLASGSAPQSDSAVAEGSETPAESESLPPTLPFLPFLTVRR
jgi:arabinose-5-phosphate isomerase